jgi:cytidylate kinase
MSAEVVCISRTVGAKGENVGRTVAERLGFQYVDEQIVVRAAELAQVDPEVVAASEHRQPLLQRLLDKLAAAQMAPMPFGGGLAVDLSARELAGHPAMQDAVRALIRGAIREVATAGRVVIVAHAASIALAFIEGVLRVLVTASPETRAQRVAAAQGIGAAEASAAVAASDRERRDYFRQFYNLKEELPTHYDLVVNTDVMTPEQATDVIVLLARGPK